MKKKFTFLPIICCFGIFILFGKSSDAATNTWTNGGGDFLWTTNANWSTGAKPVAGQDVVFNNGGTYTVTALSTIALNSITVTNSTTLTLYGSLAGQTVTIALGGNITVGDAGSTFNCGITTNPVTLSINGNITNNGTLIAKGATLQFIGAANSTIGGTASTLANTVFTFTNVLLNKPLGTPIVLMNVNIPVTINGAVVVSTGALAPSYYEVDADFTCNGSISVNNNGSLRFNSGTLNCNGLCSVNPSSPKVGSVSLTPGLAGASFANINVAGSGTATFYDSLAAGITNTVSGSVSIGSATSYLYMITNHTMFVGGNWTNTGGTFSSGAGTVSFNGSVAQTIGGSVSATFNNLTINNSSGLANGVTLSYPEFVNGVFTLTNGKLTSTSTNLLTLNTAATVSGGSNTTYVYGPMAKIILNNAAPTFMFPVGKDSAGFYGEILPIGMTGYSGGGTNVTFTAELIKRNIDAVFTPYNNSIHDAWITNVDSCEYWTLTAGAGLSSKIILSWDNTYCVVGSPGNLRVLAVNGTGWSDLDTYPGQNPTVTNTGANTGNVTSYNITSNFVAFTLGSDSLYINPLPINLLSFTATPRHNDVLVEWATASELNNASYTLEKEVTESSNTTLSSFVPIAIIEGAGNSTTTRHYEFIDDSPVKAKQWWNYYRLKQTDFDGHYKYFGPVAVRLNSSVEIGIYPTVSSGLFYYTGDWQNADVTVYSADGRKVFNTTITSETSALNLSALPQGLYFVSIQTNEGIAESRLIKTSEK